MKKILLIFAFLALAFSFNAKAQSIQELRDSMAMGNLNCQVELAELYLFGDGVEQNIDEAVRLIKDAALKGNPHGEVLLAMLYHDGVGVGKDHKEAFKWFMASAQQGDVSAKYWLGTCYEDGKGVESSPQQAIKWYKEAADGGLVEAQIATAVYYEHGNGVEQDWKESFRYMKMAVDNENTTDGARYLLAKYYFNGWGVEANRDEARRLLESIKNQEWAPDAKRTLNNIKEGNSMRMYAFQFRYISDILWTYEKGKVDKKWLTNVVEWQINLGGRYISNYEWDWKDISTNVHHPNDSIEIIVYRFPEPKETPLCLYSAAVINTKSGKCAYYTLEKTMNFGDITNLEKCWVFGGMTRDNASHVSYDGLTGDVTEQQFVDFILAFLSKSKKPSPMGETKYPTEE